MKKYIIAFTFMLPHWALAQYNCNIFKFNNNEACYQACIVAMQEAEQGSKKSQQQFDYAIQLCPTFDYAYFEKSAPFLKRGDFINWKKIIDKAVALNPRAHMGYRGWCRYQFVRDYKGAIKDFETLDSLTTADIGYSMNGDYHLNVARALCYKALGQKEKAITIIEEQLLKKDYSPMPYDYLHLGVLKIETRDVNGAILNLKKSIQINPSLADNYYYLGLAYKGRKAKSEANENFEKAKDLYLKGQRRLDLYTHPMDKVYLSDIERELTY